jgi:hypothetical protein
MFRIALRFRRHLRRYLPNSHLLVILIFILLRNLITENITLSIPRDWKLEIDRRRGDIPRSRFFLRMIQKSYGDYLDNALEGGEEMNKKKVRDIVDKRTGILKSTVSHGP